MSSIFAAIQECLMGSSQPTYSITISEKSPRQLYFKSGRTDQDIAREIVSLLFNASQNDPNLEVKIQAEVRACDWKQRLAENVLNGLEAALQKDAPMGGTIKLAFERSVCEAYEFAKEHPIYFAVIALGILVLLAPWALEALGFAELGPIEGSFAAMWQSRYAGYVPKKSLFSFFQRLGMIWK